MDKKVVETFFSFVRSIHDKNTPINSIQFNPLYEIPKQYCEYTIYANPGDSFKIRKTSNFLYKVFPIYETYKASDIIFIKKNKTNPTNKDIKDIESLKNEGILYINKKFYRCPKVIVDFEDNSFYDFVFSTNEECKDFIELVNIINKDNK